MSANIFRLKASVQNYGWGKRGNASLVAKYARGALGDDFEVRDDEHYAEIWMGTHENGPSALWDDSDVSLRGLVMSGPQHYLGPRLTKAPSIDTAKFPHSTHVPFLFKILSIRTALPLQAHPDVELAQALRARDPKQFVDANHKPEIAVALADGFRGFVGFRPVDEVVRAFERVPELKQVVGDIHAVARLALDQSKEALKEVFTKLLTTDSEGAARVVRRLVERVKREGAGAVDGDEEIARLVCTLNEQYPGDVGVLAVPFFMNLVTLNRGEAVYIGADEAHAYLEGDIIECMAVSDNVLNAAFVPPEERNTTTFLDALTYTAREPAHWALARKPYARSRMGRTSAFDPPIEEFTVLWTQLAGGGGTEERLAHAEGPTIGIVTRGCVVVEEDRDKAGEGGDAHAPASLTLGEGAVVFVKPLTDVRVRGVQGKDDAEVWWATCVDAGEGKDKDKESRSE